MLFRSLLGLFAIGLGVASLAAASQPLLQGFLLQLAGRPVDASAGVLAEHELQLIEQMPPQQQAERLMERAIGRYQGALEQIEARLHGWENKLEYSGQSDLTDQHWLRFERSAHPYRIAAADVDFPKDCPRRAHGGRSHGKNQGGTGRTALAYLDPRVTRQPRRGGREHAAFLA